MFVKETVYFNNYTRITASYPHNLCLIHTSSLPQVSEEPKAVHVLLVYVCEEYVQKFVINL